MPLSMTFLTNIQYKTIFLKQIFYSNFASQIITVLKYLMLPNYPLCLQFIFQMSNQRLTLIRLQKQQRSLQLDPIPNLLVKRKGLLNFHFCIYGLEGTYSGGFYHGILQLAADYPFSPPQLKFYTQSGRFEVNKPICTSFTNFHKQEWTSAWNVRTMLLGVISFMTSSQGGYGSLNESEGKKRLLAEKSLSRNLQNPQFVQLFKEGLKKIGSYSSNPSTGHNNNSEQINKQSTQQKVENSNALYILIGILILLLICYAVFRDSLNQMISTQF